MFWLENCSVEIGRNLGEIGWEFAKIAVKLDVISKIG